MIYAEAHTHTAGFDSQTQAALNELRDRCGMPDVPTVMPSKEAALDFVRNERRIELCFENKRFWDIRRWKMPLDEKAKGMQIEKAGESLNYKVIEVENRNYKDYMYYGPIPYSETLKYSNLKQNKGW